MLIAIKKLLSQTSSKIAFKPIDANDLPFKLPIKLTIEKLKNTYAKKTQTDASKIKIRFRKIN